MLHVALDQRNHLATVLRRVVADKSSNFVRRLVQRFQGGFFGRRHEVPQPPGKIGGNGLRLVSVPSLDVNKKAQRRERAVAVMVDRVWRDAVLGAKSLDIQFAVQPIQRFAHGELLGFV